MKDCLRLSFGYASGVVDEQGITEFVADVRESLGRLAGDLDEPSDTSVGHRKGSHDTTEPVDDLIAAPPTSTDQVHS
ncbi:hypothetical protein ACFQ1L_35790 [Phytohabitans flavus]|uniref:Uncharacterized protein n=1 Tax=Phytohabitans flavus TaxID=1076124 RepID=A0A6F8XL94_9ACTN|nr:hypothetical protein [Phytohabitans flavus]BCB74594.1 hypothetical protein Pflav_010040 [Phytohabitans flavus]